MRARPQIVYIRTIDDERPDAADTHLMFACRIHHCVLSACLFPLPVNNQPHKMDNQLTIYFTQKATMTIAGIQEGLGCGAKR